MKIKQSWTIDEELVNWLGEDNNKNKSEVVNEILWGAFNTRNDPYKKLNTITEKRIRLEAEEEQQLKVLAEIVREGDLKAREEAQKIIEAQRKEVDQKNKEQLEDLAKLKKAGLWESLKVCKNLHEINNFSPKLIDANIEIRFTKLMPLIKKYGDNNGV